MVKMFDALSIRDRLIKKLSEKTSWSKILFHSTNQRWIDVIAEEVSEDMRYDEILTIESKWNLAKQITSLMSENKFFNYYPYRKNGSTGSLIVSSDKDFSKSYGFDIIIKKYDMFSNDDIYFCSTKEQTLSKNTIQENISIVQGIAKEERFVAKGDEFETFIVKNNSIENNFFDVFVNNEPYTRLDSIRESVSGLERVFTLENLNDFSGVKLKFGNNFFGRKLSQGDVIVFKYIETLGEQGKIEASDVVKTVVSQVFDTTGKSVTVYCKNVDPIVGGSDVEDIESIRENAPKAYKAGETLITKSSFKYNMEKFSFVKKATVWGESEVNEDLGNDPGTYIASEENVIHIALISSSNSQVSDYQKDLIRREINEKKSPTDIIRFEDTNFVYVSFLINAFISNKNYTITYTTDNIRNKINEKYSIDKLDFMKPIYQSDFIATIKSADGVDFHETTFQLFCLASFESAYVFNRVADIKNVVPGSMKLYIKDLTSTAPFQMFAIDNGVGALTATSLIEILTSSVDYNTGSCTAILNGLDKPFTNYQIKIIFSVSDESILPTKRNQIISIGESNITANYI